MKRKIPMKTGDEYDAFTSWRKVLNWRAGERKHIKRRFNKKERKHLKRVME